MKFNPQLQSQLRIKKTWKSNSVVKKDAVLVLKEEFDKKGRKINETAYDGDQVPLTITDWDLNEFGDCTSLSINYVDKNNKTASFFDYVYKNDHKVKVTKYDAEKKHIQDHTFKYGDHIEETILVHGEISKIKTYTLADRLLISEVNVANNINRSYRYDEHGSIIEVREKRMNKPDKVITYQNEYDKEHRLIRQKKGDEVIEFEYNEQNYVDKRTAFKNGKVIEVITYSYSYYAP